MHDLFSLVTGPFTWIAFGVFFIGSIYKIVSLLYLAKKKDTFIFSYLKPGSAIKSAGRWLVPFATSSMRDKPVFTIVIFVFHICLIGAPLLGLAHSMMLCDALQISWFTVSEKAVDIMTVLVIVCFAFLFIRRLAIPSVRFISTLTDYLILLLVAAPFITGFVAYHQWFAYEAMIISHIIFSQILLMAIPFTRLRHALFSPLTRAYLGSEFRSVRKSRDW